LTAYLALLAVFPAWLKFKLLKNNDTNQADLLDNEG